MGKGSDTVVKSTPLRPPKAPKVIKIGSDFAGMDAITTAIARLLPVGKYKVVFQSDKAAAAKKLMQQKPTHMKPAIFFEDVLTRNENELPEVHLYAWTPPCPSFSTAGKGMGVNDPRGKLVSTGVKYVHAMQPRVAILENVKGMNNKKHKPVIKGINNALKEKYDLHWGVMNASDFQIPQLRQRLFCVLIRKDSVRHPFQWPDPMKPAINLCDILDPVGHGDLPGRLPKGKSAKKLAKNAMKDVYDAGVNPLKIPVAIDIDCSPKFATSRANLAPTITRARGGQGGPWLSSHGRRTNVKELLKCQGFYPDEVEWQAAGLSRTQIGQLIGNSVPVNMVGHILANAMYSGGLLAKAITFPKSPFGKK